MNAIATISHRTMETKGVMAGLHGDGASVIAQSRLHQSQNSAPEEVALTSVLQDSVVQQCKEPRVSLPDKFNITRSKF